MDLGLAVWGPAGVIITALASVAVFLYKELKSERERSNRLQDERLVDARETRDKITAPMEAQAEMSKKTYELLLSFISNNKREV